MASHAARIRIGLRFAWDHFLGHYYRRTLDYWCGNFGHLIGVGAYDTIDGNMGITTTYYLEIPNYLEESGREGDIARKY